MKTQIAIALILVSTVVAQIAHAGTEVKIVGRGRGMKMCAPSERCHGSVAFGGSKMSDYFYGLAKADALESASNDVAIRCENKLAGAVLSFDVTSVKCAESGGPGKWSAVVCVATYSSSCYTGH